MSIRFHLVILLIAVPLHLLAQEETATIYGRITDPDGKPIFPANIAILGTTRGTVTDEEGSFEMSTGPIVETITTDDDTDEYKNKGLQITMGFTLPFKGR